LGDYPQNRAMPKVDFRKEVVNVAIAELLEQRGSLTSSYWQFPSPLAARCPTMIAPQIHR